MEKNKMLFVICTFMLSVIAVALIVSSFSTEHWLEVNPINPNSNQNASDGKKFTGNITFGLFRGVGFVNYGAGDRPYEVQVLSDLDRYDLWALGLWASTIAFLSFGIIWGLVSMFFAIYNICAKPIETITGPLGLYVWNGLACLFTLVGVILYVVLFYMAYNERVLPKDEKHNGWTSKGRAYLSYSFYFNVGAVVFYFINLILLYVSGFKFRCSFSSSAEKTLDNGTIILY